MMYDTWLVIKTAQKRLLLFTTSHGAVPARLEPRLELLGPLQQEVALLLTQL
jgi:hypothetical protein